MSPLKKCLGVDLGSSTVKVVELAADKGDVRVLNAAQAEIGLDPGATPEQRRAATVAALKALMKANKFSTRNAVFGLSGLKVFIRRFRLPETTPERLARIVRYEARNQIPFPLDQTDWQFQAFPSPEDKEVDILLAAVRRDEVASFMSVVDKTGLKPVAVGVGSLAIFNACRVVEMTGDELRREFAPAKKAKAAKVKKADEVEEEAAGEEEVVDDAEREVATGSYDDVCAYASMGASSFDLVIAGKSGGHLQFKFARTVPKGGNEVTRVLQRKLELESFEDAERIKRHQTRLLAADHQADEDEDLNLEASRAAASAMTLVATEFRKSLEFFISQPDGMAVDRLVVVGGQAAFSGIDGFLSARLGVPVEDLRQPPAHSGFHWAFESEALGDYLPAIGFALQGVDAANLQVDFLPPARKVTRDFPWKTVGAMAAMLAVLIWITTGAGAGAASAYQRAASAAQNEFARLQPGAEAQRQVVDRHNEVVSILNELDQVAADRDYWLRMYSSINAITPATIVVDNIEMTQDGFVRIIGFADRQPAVASFNRALRELLVDPVIPPRIVQTQENIPRQLFGGNRVVGFVIHFQVADKENWTRTTSELAAEARGGAGQRRGGPMPPGVTRGGTRRP